MIYVCGRGLGVVAGCGTVALSSTMITRLQLWMEQALLLGVPQGDMYPEPPSMDSSIFYK